VLLQPQQSKTAYLQAAAVQMRASAAVQLQGNNTTRLPSSSRLHIGMPAVCSVSLLLLLLQ
jgi:hypothetical protein